MTIKERFEKWWGTTNYLPEYRELALAAYRAGFAAGKVEAMPPQSGSVGSK